VKRKAQNRAAQRAFRERKERYVKELEVKIKQVQDAHLVATAQLVHENQQLRAIIYRLESENYALKGIPIQPYQPPPPSIPQQPSLHQRSGSNYANIAPLLPQATSPQPSLLLPAYLSNLPSPISSPPVSSVLQSTSQSVNQMMMLASSPLQQYPMSPVIPVAMQNTSPTSKPISKKVAAKQTKSTPPPNNQPLEYTFSISTPASLRPNGGSTSSSKHNRSEPIELVQLYPPGGNRGHQQSAGSPASAADVSPSASNATLQKSDLIMLSPSTNNLAKKALSVASVSSNGSSTLAPFVADIPTTTTAAAATQDDNCSLTSDKTVSTVNTQTQQYKNMQQLEIDMFDCHIDTEGQLFCEKLLNEFCNDTFDRLLSEPLFDQMGKLNLSIGNYSVPIVTGPMTSNMNTLKEKEASIQGTTQDEPNNDKAQNDNDKHEQNEIESSESTKPSSEKKLLTCPEIWFILNQHSNFHKFTTDQLCQAVKELAKCADSGPVLEEPDLYQILAKMDQGQL
jgi:AP-1-like factor